MEDKVGKIFKSEIFKTVMSYLLIIVCVILIRIFFIDPVRVDGGSMDTTLANGQIMILNKIYYRKNDVKRFDIVVVDEGDKNIIKRVIGLPGETIEYSDNNVNWKEIPKDDMLFHFDFKNKYYRIKKN